ncbi:hypothetical protein B0H63DRAFT_486950 [Podospora didyma]|uniref:Uncharacterized protein n=1 Tax=Podospora didyma TaxID=330526 RepID=A0AAE0N4Y0_9PEZI|nr:hypothetical protein B0H63DRAFT_486950 [Podospora didyma]
MYSQAAPAQPASPACCVCVAPARVRTRPGTTWRAPKGRTPPLRITPFCLQAQQARQARAPSSVPDPLSTVGLRFADPFRTEDPSTPFRFVSFCDCTAKTHDHHLLLMLIPIGRITGWLTVRCYLPSLRPWIARVLSCLLNYPGCNLLRL